MSEGTLSTGAVARLMKVSQGPVERLCEEGRLRAWRLVRELLAARHEALDGAELKAGGGG